MYACFAVAHYVSAIVEFCEVQEDNFGWPGTFSTLSQFYLNQVMGFLQDIILGSISKGVNVSCLSENYIPL